MWLAAGLALSEQHSFGAQSPGSVVADAIANHVMRTYAAHYSVALYFSEVGVLRPERY